jgi:hypothetical protein
MRKKPLFTLPQVGCEHWSADGLSGVCAIGKFGGRPSPSICERCPNYSGPEERVTGRPVAQGPQPVDALLSPQRLAQIDSYKEACRACEYWLGSFDTVKGTTLEGYTKCGRCNCVSKRVSLFSGYCPVDNW